MSFHFHSRPFDHGAALRVPPPGDTKSWRVLMNWLGEAGAQLDRTGVRIVTGSGPSVAMPGDWIVLTSRGEYQVARHVDGLARA